MKPILRAAVLAIAAAASPSLACAAEKLVVAWSSNPQTPQVDVALAEGYFEDAGLEIEFISFVSGSTLQFLPNASDCDNDSDDEGVDDVDGV